MIDTMHPKVMPVPFSGCWLWLASLDSSGYGQAWDDSRKLKTTAHRLAWTQHRGPIPAGLSVLHKCDIRSCVNPDHLSIGTHSDNMKDLAAKGKKKGENSSRAKLTNAQVLEIFFNRRIRRGEFAAKYNVSRSAVAYIREGRSWTHITGKRYAAPGK